MPDMAIVDADFQMTAPRGLTCASGIDVVSHDLEALVSTMATDYTDSLALQSLKMVFDYLPRAYELGAKDPEAREKMANAATMAGMAFANAFLGISHSLAHKLGAFHHLPHGICNALVLEEVIRYNASEVPGKMGTFPQYDHPMAQHKYAMAADVLGLGGRTDEEKVKRLIKAVADLKAKIDIKPTIKTYIPDEKVFLETLDEMSEKAFDDQCTGANPRYPLISDLKQIYLNAYYGKTFVEEAKPSAKDLKARAAKAAKAAKAPAKKAAAVKAPAKKAAAAKAPTKKAAAVKAAPKKAAAKKTSASSSAKKQGRKTK